MPAIIQEEETIDIRLECQSVLQMLLLNLLAYLNNNFFLFVVMYIIIYNTNTYHIIIISICICIYIYIYISQIHIAYLKK